MTPNFDYTSVDQEQKGKLIWCAGEIQRLKKKGAEVVIELGRVLATAQEVLSHHGDGVFGKWIDGECGFSKRSAYRAIAVFQKFGDVNCATLAQIEVTSLYELAQNETPKKAVNEVLKLAGSGEKITAKKASEIIKKHEVKEERKEPPKPDVAGLSETVVEQIEKGKVTATPEQIEALKGFEEDTQEELVESVVEGKQTLAQAIETGEVPEPTLEERMQGIDSEIESFCRQLVKYFHENFPPVPWRDYMGLDKSAEGEVKAAAKTMRMLKARVCPKCSGEGCEQCSQWGEEYTGLLPVHLFHQL